MIISGVAKWAKVVGAPVDGYEGTFKEWSIEVFPDADTIKKLVTEGFKANFKDKGDGKFLTFRRKELKQDGTKNQPIRIVDRLNQPWDGRKIGNGSIVNVNFAANEYKPGKFALNILSLQVRKLVPYEGRGEFETYEDEAETTGDDWSSEVAA